MSTSGRTSTTNRLIHEPSPYLLQHAHNPVEWRPWGAEAMEAARREDKPIFLSVGYSTCHWCHVMAHESFEDDQAARLLNEHFVPVKVDREQRPDIDEIYMTATQLLTGRGGWPNSVWLTPDGRPWFAGTYFPREDAPGRVGFKTLLRSLHQAWTTRRDEIEAEADRISQAVRQVTHHATDAARAVLNRGIADTLIEQLSAAADRVHGGFDGAPKFPPHASLRFLLSEFEDSGNRLLQPLLTGTLDAMARGGIHDHLAGGFHRYSTDARWLLPHFEKMLYDNAQLATVYAQASVSLGRQDYAIVSRRTLDWILADLTDPVGGFHSAYDADSEGGEGAFYLWTRRDIIDLLGQAEGEFFCRAYNVTEAGNHHDEATGRATGKSILHRTASWRELAEAEGIDEAALHARIDAARPILLEARRQRPWPGRDDKVLTAWNGLAIEAFALAGRLLGEPGYVLTAAETGDSVLRTLHANGRLLTGRRGEVKAGPAYLDDYAFVLAGLLELHKATGDRRWLDECAGLAEEMVRHHHDAGAGGFFFIADDAEALLSRIRNPVDRAIPSGNGMAARSLLKLADRTGDSRYRELAEQTIRGFWSAIRRAPRATETLVLAAVELMDHPMARPAEAQQTASTVPAVSEHQPAATARTEPVTAELFLSAARTGEENDLAVRLKLHIDEGFHINSHQPHQDYLVASSLAVRAPTDAELTEVRFPPPTDLPVPYTEKPLSVFTGDVTIPARLRVPAGLSQEPLVLALRFQACDDNRCLPPARLVLKTTGLRNAE